MITFITSNRNKAAELAELLDIEIAHKALDLPEIQSLDVAEVARVKAEAAYAIVKSPVIIDDSSFVIEEWGRLPGPFIKHFLDEMGDAKMAQMVGENRVAYAETALAYCDEHGAKVAIGRLDGTVSPEPRGENGYGYDTIFIPNGKTKTRAEMSDEEKVTVFPRAIAVEELKKIL